MKLFSAFTKKLFFLLLVTVLMVLSQLSNEVKASESSYYYYDSFISQNGAWIEQVIAPDGTYPNNGLHNNDKYYVRGKVAGAPDPYFTWSTSRTLYIGSTGFSYMQINYDYTNNSLTLKLSDSRIGMQEYLDFNRYDYRLIARSVNYQGETSLDAIEYFSKPFNNESIS